MEKTLQQQYNLIKEGKGSKDDFLKSARRVFPEFVTPVTDYNTAVHILKAKSILSENAGGVITTGRKDWWKIFDANLKEAVGVKDKEEYGDQNTFKASKETIETLKKANFDNSNPDNIDNVYGQSFLLGYLTEMGDPKNANKTVDELKKIVAKNMAKDINYYHTNSSFGVKGIGYTKDAPGMGEPKAPKGKYKSSGYGDLDKATVKESIKTTQLRSVIREIIKEELSESYDDMYGIDSEAETNNISYNKAVKLAKAISREGVVQHVNELPDGSYEVSDRYDADSTVMSFENGIEI